MKLGIFHFQVLYQVLENIHFIYDEDELANVVLTNVASALNAEAGSIFKLQKDGTITPLAAYGAPIGNLRKMDFRVGQGVVGWVAQYAQPVKVEDPRKDTRFSGSADERTGFKTRSIVAAPILSKGQVVGVIEFLNRKGGPFAIPDLELISMIGREIGIAFENVTLIRTLEKSRAFLHSVLESLSAGIIVVGPEGDVVEINPRAQAILGVRWQAEGPPQSALQALASCAEMLDIVRQAANLEAPLNRQEREMIVSGKKRRIGYSAVPIRGKSQARLGTTILFQDLTDLKN